MSIKVAIVEDDLITLDGLKTRVDSSEELFCCGTFENAENFSNKFKHLDVDVVLMDIDLKKGMNGIECVKALKPDKPGVQFLMCTDFEDDDKIFSALSVGATGYILKNNTSEKIISAIKEIHSGGSPMTPKIARKVAMAFQIDKKRSDQINSLTQKEKETIELLAKGHPYKEVAEIQGVSIETIRTRIRDIYAKLQVHNRTDAINKIFPRIKN